MLLVHYFDVTLIDPPGSPVNVIATILSCDRVQLQWTPPTYPSNYSPIKYSPIKYNIISSPSGSCSNQFCTTIMTSYNVTELELNAFNYNFTVSSSVCDCEEYSKMFVVSLEKLGKFYLMLHTNILY